MAASRLRWAGVAHRRRRSGPGPARVPVLLLYGAHDALVQPGPAIARATALNPRVRSLVYAQSGHAPFLDEPARFNRDLAAFMAALAR